MIYQVTSKTAEGKIASLLKNIDSVGGVVTKVMERVR